MKVTVIGCSGSFAGPDSTASCYLVEAPDTEDPTRTWRILLDLGSGALGALQRHCDPLLVDAVFISHLHPDHFFDISGYYVLRKYHPEGPQPQIPVWGPRGTKSRMARAYGLPLDPGMNDEFAFKRLRRGEVELGPFTVTARRVDHPIEAYALRVECGGRALVYSGDTAACDSLTRLARGADLLLAEAAFRDGRDNPPHVHMTGSEAARTAEDAAVGTLVLTHIPPWHEKAEALHEAEGVYSGPVLLAAEGATYEV
ncbi:MBL fold metallo-hydrolase [Nocardioides caldifontis]|uniref:MBL fold metallo-hydrolase n=1 Tax=Nocardioides caldifontis TaxID=2588938 RepID=UPI0011DF3B37|nr:MBL fold metallo-hydrolase [Nocardioides caldifontis]